MENIFDVLRGTAALSDVAAMAALDVLCAALVVAAVMLLSRVLEAVAKGVIALFVGSGGASIVEGYLTYPGVVYHELSHALFALVSGARVTGISLRRRPSSDGRGWVLGSVTFVPRGNRVLQSFQLAFTGVAPLVTGMAAMYLMLRYAFPACTETWQELIWGYLFLCVLLHTELSRADLRRILEGLPIVLLALFAIFLVVPQSPRTMLLAVAGWFGAGSAAGV